MVAPRVKFRLVSHKDSALRRAPSILQKNLRGGLQAVGKRLQASARSRMRQDTGREQKSLKITVEGTGLNLNLLVYSTLVQAFIDAYGLRRGVFPPFGVNSRLYKWASRRLNGHPTKRVKAGVVPKGLAKSVEKRRARRATIRTKRSVKRIKSINGLGNARSRFRARNTDAKRLSFLIARAIYKRGIKATEWPRKTLEANKARIIREMSNAVSRAANEIKRA